MPNPSCQGGAGKGEQDDFHEWSISAAGSDALELLAPRLSSRHVERPPTTPQSPGLGVILCRGCCTALHCPALVPLSIALAAAGSWGTHPGTAPEQEGLSLPIPREWPMEGPQSAGGPGKQQCPLLPLSLLQLPFPCFPPCKSLGVTYATSILVPNLG